MLAVVSSNGPKLVLLRPIIEAGLRLVEALATSDAPTVAP